MPDDLLNRLAALERRIRAGLTLVRLTVTGALSAGSLTVGGVAFPVSGTWTPTLDPTTNVAASTAYLGQYMRIGNVVHCSVRADIDVTAATTTVLGISLPIASNFGANRDCVGVGAGVTGGAGEIRANVAGDRAEFAYVSTVTANNAFYLIFSYVII